MSLTSKSSRSSGVLRASKLDKFSNGGDSDKTWGRRGNNSNDPVADVNT